MKLAGFLILIGIVAGCTSVDRGTVVSSVDNGATRQQPDTAQYGTCEHEPWSWCAGYREKP
jgi:hypothetical protein